MTGEIMADGSGQQVSVTDLARFADAFADLADGQVMAHAWS